MFDFQIVTELNYIDHIQYYVQGTLSAVQVFDSATVHYTVEKQ